MGMKNEHPDGTFNTLSMLNMIANPKCHLNPSFPGRGFIHTFVMVYFRVIDVVVDGMSCEGGRRIYCEGSHENDDALPPNSVGWTWDEIAPEIVRGNGERVFSTLAEGFIFRNRFGSTVRQHNTRPSQLKVGFLTSLTPQTFCTNLK